MIKEIQKLLDKYKKFPKHCEYIAIGQVVNDLYRLQQQCRLKRIKKDER